MPAVYENVDFTEDGSRPWHFEKYRPAIVSIGLGTNDFSNGDGTHVRAPFDSAVLVRAYTKFAQQIKSKYPAVQIALLGSPIRTNLPRCSFSHLCKRGDVQVILLLRAMQSLRTKLFPSLETSFNTYCIAQHTVASQCGRANTENFSTFGYEPSNFPNPLKLS